jgi:hypothetical protein
LLQTGNVCGQDLAGMAVTGAGTGSLPVSVVQRLCAILAVPLYGTSACFSATCRSAGGMAVVEAAAADGAACT